MALRRLFNRNRQSLGVAALDPRPRPRPARIRVG